MRIDRFFYLICLYKPLSRIHPQLMPAKDEVKKVDKFKNVDSVQKARVSAGGDTWELETEENAGYRGG